MAAYVNDASGEVYENGASVLTTRCPNLHASEHKLKMNHALAAQSSLRPPWGKGITG